MEFFIEISAAAEFDLEVIFDYTENEFGVDQAVRYVSSFDDAFEMLLLHPESGRDRSEIREELRSILKERHVVFYRIKIDRIRIVRVLHGARDLPKQFSDY